MLYVVPFPWLIHHVTWSCLQFPIIHYEEYLLLVQYSATKSSDIWNEIQLILLNYIIIALYKKSTHEF